jgi:transketolase
MSFSLSAFKARAVIRTVAGLSLVIIFSPVKRLIVSLPPFCAGTYLARTLSKPGKVSDLTGSLLLVRSCFFMISAIASKTLATSVFFKPVRSAISVKNWLLVKDLLALLVPSALAMICFSALGQQEPRNLRPNRPASPRRGHFPLKYEAFFYLFGSCQAFFAGFCRFFLPIMPKTATVPPPAPHPGFPPPSRRCWGGVPIIIGRLLTASRLVCVRNGMEDFTDLDRLAITTIRTLAMDAVQKAHSGHPGAPMGLAPAAYVLWSRFLTYDPDDPLWPNRDRFILSNGHASMLLYALIHLAGIRHVDEQGRVTDQPSLPLEQIQAFRQLGSRTPGHPEFDLTTGVETTTGPLGQGVANAVGLAIAQRWLAATYARPGFEALFDHHIYCFCGDGCLMEGIAAEAASLAGHLRLANLTLLYDDNHITIDGPTELAFTEDVPTRFQAYGWHVLRLPDGNDLPAIADAFRQARQITDRPTLICLRTHIGYGSPNKQDTHAAHGEPLGAEEVRLTKRFYGWPEDAQFLVPPQVVEHFRQHFARRGAQARQLWQTLWERYRQQFPELAEQLLLLRQRRLPLDWNRDLPSFPPDAKGLATRDSSGQVLNLLAQRIPWLLGGSADLNPSTKTFLKFPAAGVFTATSPHGRNIHFGVREHAMAGILNGLALAHLRPYGSSFLVFTDYCRPAIRLSALMHLPVLYIFTHDSIAVGEDGPTHQPVEHLAALRAIPNLLVIRPCDANEVVEAYRVALQQTHRPVLLALTRQAVPTLDRSQLAPASGLARGAYILLDTPNPQVLLLASGSEVHLCLEAAALLRQENISARVVSMPSWELFEEQPRDYRDSVLPPQITARVCVEMAVPLGWERYAGPTGAILAMRSFGASAPYKDVTRHFGFTPQAVAAAAKAQLARETSH